jgi:geranyl-CoA carboxylase beta subunit
MPFLDLPANPRSDSYQRNRAAMLELVSQLRGLEAAVRASSARKQPKFDKRGQLLPRERVSRLLDRGAPFLELSTLAGYKMHDDDGKDDIAGGGNVIGIGYVAGRRVMVSASDSAIKGGAVSPMGLRKSLRAQEIALQQRLPVVSLVESAGANLLYQAEIFVDGGRIFANMARLSAAGIPQLTVVHGSSTAGGAYLPGLSDYVVVVRGKSKIFLAGPPLVKAATGEEATDEELGGAQMHAEVSGTAEYLAEDDGHALAIARDLVDKLAWPAASCPPQAQPRPPRFDPDELLGVVPADYREPYDPRLVIARIVDDSDFLEFKAAYGAGIVCGHARIDGRSVGILANQGPIFPEGSQKAAHFIQTCEQSGTPLLFLQNTTGYMVGVAAETAGAIKHGSKMIQAVANATVPKISILIGGSFGAGNYGMCGRAYDPRFIFAWPNARISVMGGEQAAKVMEIITRAKFQEMGAKVDDATITQMGESIRKRLDGESTALYATARLWDDGLIDPRDTRRVVAECLAICAEAEQRVLRPSTFGVARM